MRRLILILMLGLNLFCGLPGEQSNINYTFTIVCLDGHKYYQVAGYAMTYSYTIILGDNGKPLKCKN